MSTNAWVCYECSVGGKPASVLIDTSLRYKNPVRELPWLLWLGIWCNLPSPNSWWHPDESTRLDGIEDDLIASVKTLKPGLAVYVLRICTPGMRELYTYVDSAKGQQEILAALKRKYANYRIEIDSTEDPAWKIYDTYLPPKY